MKKTGKIGRIVRITAIGLAVVLTILLLMFNSGVTALRRISGVVVNPVLIGFDTAKNAVTDFFGGFSARMGLREELARAQEELARLESVESMADEVRAENERLSALLNEKGNYPEFVYRHAHVIARSVDDYSATFTLDKGTSDGIETNMVVIAAGGLAGKIVEVSDSTCILLALIDARCGVPALSEASRDMGVVKGVSDGGETSGYCVMSELPANAIIKPGDTVITSGMGEVYPKGLVIGKITEVSQGNTSQINSSARLTPAVDFAHLENVLILIGPEEN